MKPEIPSTELRILGRDMARSQGPAQTGANFAWEDPGTESLTGAFQYTVSLLRRQWPILATGAALGLSLFILTLVVVPGQYEGTATIMFDPTKMQVFQSQIVSDNTLESTTALESQIQMISSEAVARRAMKKLNLFDDPALAPPEKGRIERWFGPQVASYFGRPAAHSEKWKEHYRVDAFMGGIDVKRQYGTYAVNIGYMADDPAKAAQYANAIAESFIEKQMDDFKGLNESAAGWLRTHLDDVGQQAASAQNQINSFRNSNSMVEGTGQALWERRMGELNAQLMAERSKIGDAEARLERVDAAIKEYNNATVKPSLPDLMNNPVVTKLREQYFELTNKRAEFVSRYGAKHEAARKIEQRLNEIHMAMLDEYQRLAESYRSDIDIAKRREITIAAALKEVVDETRSGESARIKLREMQSSAQNYQALYDGFLHRYTEVTEQGAFPFTRVKLFNEASEPMGRNYKKPAKLGALLMGLGFAIGLSGALLRELSDRTFRRPDDIEHTLGQHLVAIVPDWNTSSSRQRLSFESKPVAPVSARSIIRKNSIIWAPDIAPHSQVAESIRAIKLILDQKLFGQSSKVVGVASAMPGEGSSTVAASLAITACMSNARVLLLDFDLRNPVLSGQLAPKAATGLIDVLVGDAAFDDAVWTDHQTGLAFLPTGMLRGMRPDELLGSTAVDRFMSEMRTRYDYIVFDLPPLVPMIDVALTVRLTDTFLGVVEWGRSEKEVTRLAFDRVPEFSNLLMGVAMNKVNLKRLGLFDPNAAHWFNEKLYANYNRVSDVRTDARRGQWTRSA